jgi:hypothetical protein
MRLRRFDRSAGCDFSIFCTSDRLLSGWHTWAGLLRRALFCGTKPSLGADPAAVPPRRRKKSPANMSTQMMGVAFLFSCLLVGLVSLVFQTRKRWMPIDTVVRNSGMRYPTGNQ